MGRMMYEGVAAMQVLMAFVTKKGDKSWTKATQKLDKSYPSLRLGFGSFDSLFLRKKDSKHPYPKVTQMVDKR
jgi:hypothetical protein